MYEEKGIAEEMGLEKEYHISCVVHEVNQQGRKGKDDSQTFDTKRAVLEPLSSTQMQLFLGAWLPGDDVDPDENDQELLVSVGYPYRVQKARVSLAHANRFFPKIHLLVMDEGLEENLLKHGVGKKIGLKIHPQSDELRDAGIPLD